MLTQEEVFRELAEAVIKRDRKKVEEFAHQVVTKKFDAFEAINKGLAAGMAVVGQKFDQNEYFVPELLMAAKAMMAGVDILKPHITGLQMVEKGVCVIGTVKGDLHSIGKDIVAVLWEASGFEVHNLGVNVEHKVFVDRAQEHKADIVGISALMSTTMNYMKDIVTLFREAGVRDQHMIMVGGAPISQKWCDVVGADGFAPNAAQAVEMAKVLLREKRAS
jgi:corrinoid protein of di/trimethylamine methyltransferase